MADTNITGTVAAAAEVLKRELTVEERRRRYAEMRSKMGRSKIEVKCPAGITAFWAMKSNEYERARMDWLGYKLVREDMKPGAVRRFSAAGLMEDGTYVLGDVILMEIDTEIFELQKQIEVDDFDQLRRSIAQEFKDSGSKEGVPTFEVDDKGTKQFQGKTT